MVIVFFFAAFSSCTHFAWHFDDVLLQPAVIAFI